MQLSFERQLKNPSFGEDIIYTSEGQIPIPLRAHVYRGEYEQHRQRFEKGTFTDPIKYSLKIRISSRLVASITERRDTVTAKLKLDSMATVLKVVAVVGQDPGTWLLGLNA